MNPEIVFYIVVFLYGIVIGSFLNVCIYRIPKKENIVKTHSHCMACGEKLRWYDLIPLVSYLFLGGKCRKCKSKISAQYPIIEAANGLLYVLVFAVKGFQPVSIIYCLFVSALLTLSVIDFRTYEIPLGINIMILTLGLIHLAMDLSNWLQYAIGLLSVSVFLLIIYYVTKGRGIGGGDVKLMAVCGLLLGWQCNLLGFLIGCILGSVIHLLRMKFSKADHVLAMGPYLAMGTFLAMLWGDQMISWYLSSMF